ncbi:MAG: ABC transporter permease [archaeon]
MNASEKCVAFATITRKEVVRFLRIWPQTILPSIVNMTLYLGIFGEFIGQKVGSIGGATYLQFIVPGLVMMSVITNSYSNVVSSFFSSKFLKSVEEFLVSPTPDSLIILGYTMGGILRGLLVGIAVLAVSLFFTSLRLSNPPLVLLFIFLTSVMFSLGGLVNGIIASKFDDISIIPVFVLTPLTYLGGVFYSISDLPPFWQAVSKANPILYMVNGFRFGFLGISDVNVYAGLGIISASIIALYSLSHYMLAHGIRLKK